MFQSQWTKSKNIIPTNLKAKKVWLYVNYKLIDSETKIPTELKFGMQNLPHQVCGLGCLCKSIIQSITVRHGRVSNLFYYPGFELFNEQGKNTRSNRSSFIRGQGRLSELATGPT